MAFNAKQKGKEEEEPYKMEEEEEEDDDEEEQVWDDWEGDEGDPQLEFLCLFCDSHYGSCGSLFDHCASLHHFDFHAIRKALNLDFYASFKIINFIRSQVAERRCWSCGLTCQSNNDLQNHLHDVTNFNDIKKALWDDDRYLKPFMQDDSLLYSFGECGEEGEDEQITPMDEDLLRDLMITEETFRDDQSVAIKVGVNGGEYDACRRMETASASNDCLNWASPSNKELSNGKDSSGNVSCSDRDPEEGYSMAYSQNHIAKHIMKVNENYFGSYSSFGIHREMLSDKARMDAYGQAILKNPSLINGAVVMDVGCGTGILSLFAAKAGASRVIAVEASAKMAAVASQVAKDNGLWLSKGQNGVNALQKGVVEVVHGMVEEIDKTAELQPHSVDVLLSEWMGYCLLYESMLGSVLFARERWLKPGGAILPDTATIFVAGFGKGATSLSFWENVCDFDMSCIGKELVIDAARIPIVDIVDSQDLVTSSAILQTFDLATMKPNEVDFTATATLQLKPTASDKNEMRLNSKTCCWCHGVVLWFETGFTSRFCRETPVVLSTSPYTPRTHWSQTILTFREPIAMGSGKENGGKLEAIGTDVYPAVKIDLRVSIVRSTEHRSIDISLEAAGVDPDGRRRSWPAQPFSLH
ncbi:probable protein arginine N-methyltransferase 3 [Abrus precatorius]|uniref:Probable protein arginine N-methyltransferase 3 n=1 Tax=Abrus precatorius TaxID=3816 RepID=A0A8B8KGL7_ABRPR|nr:probable protein arginine N-methyltransferase 3 [Abrus precatorius]